MDNSTIKNKQLQFTHNETTFRVKIKYDTSSFGVGNKSFWQTSLYQVNDERLLIPLTYKYVQHQGRLLLIPKFREHRFFCSSRRKPINNQTNLYPLVKEQVIYQWLNQKVIFRYQAQINNFNFLVKNKYQQKLIPLLRQKRELKQRLKSEIIDNKQFQKLYTPIRKQINEIEFHIWNICYTYNKRYFNCDKLKSIYRVAWIDWTLCHPECPALCLI